MTSLSSGGYSKRQPAIPGQRPSGPEPIGRARSAHHNRAERGEVVIVSDGSGLRHQRPPRLRVQPTVRAYAALIKDLGGPHAVSQPVTARSNRELIGSLQALPADTGAVYLAHTDPERGFVAQRALSEAGGPPLITDQDTTAIGLTAELLTALMRAGRQLATSYVVVAGADAMPNLCPLLMAAGIRDIGIWKQADAAVLPLAQAIQGADAVIDVRDRASSPHDSGIDGPSVVVAPNDPTCSIVAVPGLLRAVVDAANPRMDVGVYGACAHALVMATPADRCLPTPDLALTDSVAWATAQALKHDPGT